MLSKRSYEEINKLIENQKCCECNSNITIDFIGNGVDLICTNDNQHITGHRILFDETTFPPSPRIISDIQIIYLAYITTTVDKSAMRDLIGIYLDDKVAKKRCELYLEKLQEDSELRGIINYSYQIKRIETDIPYFSLINSMMEFQSEVEEYENS